jgi:hypothetical protein
MPEKKFLRGSCDAFQMLQSRNECERYISPVTGLERPRKLRFSDYMTTAQDGVKVVSL